MRQKLLAIAAIAVATACGTAHTTRIMDENRVVEWVDSLRQAQPSVTLADVYKTLFQDRFGPGHIIANRETARQYIMEEIAAMDTSFCPLIEPTGFEGNFVRVNLLLIKNGTLHVDDFVDALMESAAATPVKPEGIEEWKVEWERIATIIDAMNPDWPDHADVRQRITSDLEQGIYWGHHSPQFNEAAKPHYRIIRTDIYRRQILPKLNH